MECYQVHEDRVSNRDSSIWILKQLLYYVTIGGEKKHANVREVELRAALLLCGGQGKWHQGC